MVKTVSVAREDTLGAFFCFSFLACVFGDIDIVILHSRRICSQSGRKLKTPGPASLHARTQS